MGSVYTVVLTVGFAAGTALFAVLAALAWKAGRITGRLPGVFGLAAVGLLWNLPRFALELAVLAGARYDSHPIRLVDAIAYASTALLPTVLLFGIEPSAWRGAWQKRAHRWLRLYSVAAALLLIALILVAGATLGGTIPIRATKSLSAVNLILHLAAACVVYHGAALPGSLRTYARALVVLGAMLAVSLLLVTTDAVGGLLEDAISIVAQLLSIPFGVAGLMLVSRFRFADLFIRRAASLIAAIVIATTATLLVTGPVAGAAWRLESARAETAVLVAASLLGSLLLLAFPRLDRTLGRRVDSWLFDRRDYNALLREVARALEPLDSEALVVESVAESAQRALEGARVVALEADRVPGVASIESATGAFDLPADHRVRLAAEGLEIDALAPIWVHGRIVACLAASLSGDARGLLSEELRFLTGLGTLAGRRLEALGAERERREREIREVRLQRMVTEAQLKALRAQLNPHFLFNTLNTILDLIATAPEQAEAVTERLADVLRYVLERTDRALSPVEEEIDFLRAYLDIERVRFGERIRASLTIEPEAAGEAIPSLILQPLVENAIKHGLGPKPEGGRLEVRVARDGERLRLRVEDDGLGPAAPQPYRDGVGGIGLRNIEEHLRALYGAEARMTIDGAPGAGFRVELSIPRRTGENSDRRRRSAREIAAPQAARSLR